MGCPPSRPPPALLLLRTVRTFNARAGGRQRQRPTLRCEGAEAHQALRRAGRPRLGPIHPCGFQHGVAFRRGGGPWYKVGVTLIPQEKRRWAWKRWVTSVFARQSGGLDGLCRPVPGHAAGRQEPWARRPSGWTTRSSASWSMRTRPTRQASSAGRWRMLPRSTPTRPISNAARCRSPAARGRSPRSARSRDRSAVGPGRQPARDLPRRRDHHRSVQARPRHLQGFRTGPLGMGHAVLHCEKIGDILPFLPGHPGLQAQRLFHQAVRGLLLHVNPRHHSVAACIESGKVGIHHLMVETCYLDDVGQGYDLAQKNSGDDRDHLRPALQRPGPLVLFVVAIEVHVRIRLGRPHHRDRRLDSRRSSPRVRACGAMSAIGSTNSSATRRASFASPTPRRATACRST